MKRASTIYPKPSEMKENEVIQLKPRPERAPEISVVIPVYNAAPFLERTLACLKGQNFTDFEMIFVNDGSTDGSLRMLEDFAKNWGGQKVTLITQKNQGPGAARNAGLEQARGRFLALLDADDIYEPDFLEKLHHAALLKRADIVVARADEYWPDLNRTVNTPWTINAHLLPKKEVFSANDIAQNFFEAFVGWTWDKLFRTEFIRENQLKFQELRSSDDAFFCFMALIKASRITVVDEVLAHHRKLSLDIGGAPSAVPAAVTKSSTKSTPVRANAAPHATSVSSSREKSWDNFYLALSTMRDQMKKWKIYKRFEQDYINYFLNFSLWHLSTLTGKAYVKLFDKLKKEWWKKQGVASKKREYFYNSENYDLYKQAVEMSAEEFLFALRAADERKIRELEWHNQNLWRDVDNLHAEIDEKNRILSARDHEKARAEAEASALKKEVEDIKSSTTWKVGSAATSLPRKIKEKLKR